MKRPSKTQLIHYAFRNCECWKINIFLLCLFCLASFCEQTFFFGNGGRLDITDITFFFKNEYVYVCHDLQLLSSFTWLPPSQAPRVRVVQPKSMETCGACRQRKNTIIAAPLHMCLIIDSYHYLVSIGKISCKTGGVSSEQTTIRF